MAITPSTSPTKKVLVIGASGLTGQLLVKKLINDIEIDEIHLLLRRKSSISSSKVHQHIIDFNNIEIFNYLFQCDVIFCCLGTTLRIAKTKANFKAVDIELVSKCAELAASENCTKLIIISAIGANSRSLFFYNKCKGEMQNNVIAACADTQTQVVFCQPSLLLGAREEKRKAEELSAKLSLWFNFIWHGAMKKYQPITASQLASAMLELAKIKNQESVTVVNNQTLHQLSIKH
ncbi:NAD(P)H-binding protein [Thalassotalea profundi]|uniref:Oxidoreductase n=1 Tax=Thalassotalea profundi TaxID=2036687 RepID=A0ABQ3J0K0_9GAMM|nr:NAD(P)H-binding protein [Thalassotalea profundi]GHE98777.1 oxidoreductase [Thalassotalea profundi]